MTALVTGSAGGIGGAIVGKLRAEGFDVQELDLVSGFDVSDPLPVSPVFGLIAARGSVSEAEMWRVFNMGCGFCAVVPAERATDAVALLDATHPGTAVIGAVSAEAGRIVHPAL